MQIYADGCIHNNKKKILKSGKPCYSDNIGWMLRSQVTLIHSYPPVSFLTEVKFICCKFNCFKLYS